MARVDPDDDAVHRFVVQHYRYDPDRHQRRRVDVAAFDNQDEYDAAVAALRDAIDQRRGSDEDTDPQERAGGTERPPGSRRRAAYGRMVFRAALHGVDVGPLLAHEDMPRNIAVLTVSREEPTEPESTR